MWARSGWALVGVGILALAACSNIISSQQNESRETADAVRAVDLQPRFPASPVPATAVPRGSSGASYYGSNTVIEGVQSSPQAASGGEGYDLNFENAPVVTVAKVILGDILQAGYTIDPRVQGTVTLASGRPVPRSDLLYVLENALRLSNVALVGDQRDYRLIPASEAVGQGGIDRSAGRAQAGYGITVIPLRYVSSPTLLKLLDSFATKPGTVRADGGRNMLIVQGTGTERQNALDVALSFDADWMRGQSVGIFTIRNGTPAPIISELEKIMDTGEGGLSANLVKLQAIARLNAILVVAAKPELLRSAGTWIGRLDRADAEATGVRVYQVRYGDARQLARLLSDMFVGRQGGGLDNATNQLAPGSGAIIQSSSDGLPQAGLRLGGAANPAGIGTGGTQVGNAGGINTRPQGSTLQPGGARQPAGADTTISFGGNGAPILTGVRITADTTNNSILIYANQENYRTIERTLAQLDKPQLQVAIDATIAEITLNENLAYGVQAFLKSSDVGLGRDKGSLLSTQSSALAAATTTAVQSMISRVLPGFNFLLGPEAEPRLILDALRTITDVKVISTPSVVVLDNQIATLQVGDQVPISTGTATVLSGANPIVSSIDYRNTGVILRVVPRINVNGNVLLDVEQEISNVNGNANTLTPTVSQRKVKSSIGVASGQTVLLAGLISERQENDQNSIPFLDQLGELGKTLGHTTKATQRTELIIFIRPQIIRDGLDASRIAEELRSKMRGSRVGSSELLKLPQLPPPPRAPAPPPNPLLVAPAPATPLTPPGAPLSVRN